MYSRVESTSLETKRMLTQAKHCITKDKFPKEFDMYLKSITMRPASSAVINAHSMAELRQPVPVYQAELGLTGIAELDGENAEYFVQAQRKLNRLFRDFARMSLLTTPINNELKGA